MTDITRPQGAAENRVIGDGELKKAPNISQGSVAVATYGC